MRAFFVVFVVGCAAQPKPHPATYDQALRSWRSIEDVNAWIGRRFTYDTNRAAELSEARRSQSGATQIYEPAAFYGEPTGVCVDLARFAYETTKQIEPSADPKYLMLEMDPISVDGEILRRHWFVIFTRAGQLYSFADSKRPGHIAGPFPSLERLVADYELFRQRRIISSNVMDDFKKKKRQRQMRAAKTPGDASGI